MNKIVSGGGDYIMAVKDNHPTLHEEVKLLFDDAIDRNFEQMGYDFHEQVDKDHGRIETRRVWVTRDIDWLPRRGQWMNLRSAMRRKPTTNTRSRPPSSTRQDQP